MKNYRFASFDSLKSDLLSEKLLSKTDLISLLSQCKQIFLTEPNILQVTDPVTIIGDIHGQFYDLVNILSFPSTLSMKYLFLGDYVDRGDFSIEIVTYLMYLKLKSPKNIWILRGNHESRSLSKSYGFLIECLSKYDLEVYEEIMSVFTTLPIASVINNIIFAVHGGISENLKKIQEINQIDRFQEIPSSGLFCDILWSDVNYDETCQKIKKNMERGCSILYTKQSILNFLANNNFVCIIRAHEQCDEGFKMKYWLDDYFPAILTIFSAPNYCDRYGNKGAIAVLNDCKLNIKQFRAVEHPFTIPNHENLFEWTFSFIVSKIKNIFSVILKPDDSKAVIDEYTLDRLKEIVESQNITLDELTQAVDETDSLTSFDIPQDECELNIPKISSVKMSLQFRTYTAK